MTRLQGVAEAHIDILAPEAPDAVRDESIIRMVGYLYDSPTASRRDSYANAFVNSGAGALLTHWIPQAVSGSVGSLGGVGAVGPQGERGAVGPTGPQGDAGPRGERGAVGPTGPQGDAGPRGERGAVGPTGPQGDAGPRGDAGAHGEAGARGPQGEAGPQGDAGPAGGTGPQGERGERGERGDAGARLGIQQIGTAIVPALATDGVIFPVNLPDGLVINDVDEIVVRLTQAASQGNQSIAHRFDGRTYNLAPIVTSAPLTTADCFSIMSARNFESRNNMFAHSSWRFWKYQSGTTRRLYMSLAKVTVGAASITTRGAAVNIERKGPGATD